MAAAASSFLGFFFRFFSSRFLLSRPFGIVPLILMTSPGVARGSCLGQSGLVGAAALRTGPGSLGRGRGQTVSACLPACLNAWSNQVQTQIGTNDAATQSEAPDLQSQLEALLDAVWLGERWAKTEDRIDAAVRYAPSGR